MEQANGTSDALPGRVDTLVTANSNLPDAVSEINAVQTKSGVDCERGDSSAINQFGASIIALKTASEVTNVYQQTPPIMPDSDTGGEGDSCFLGDIISQSNSFDNREIAAANSNHKALAPLHSEKHPVAPELDLRPPRPNSKNSVDGVRIMDDSVLSFPLSGVEGRTVSPGAQSYEEKFSSIQLDDNWSTAGGAAASRDPSEVGSSHHSTTSPRIILSNSSLSGERRCSPDKSILDLLDEDEQIAKSIENEEDEVKPYSHVSAAHEILNSFIAMNPTADDRVDDSDNTPMALKGIKGSFASIEDRIDDEIRKPSSPTPIALSPHEMPKVNFTRKNTMHAITSASSNSDGADCKSLNSKNSSADNIVSPSSPSKTLDKRKLNERLKQRLAERNQRIRSGNGSSPDKLIINTQVGLQKTHKRPASCSSESFSSKLVDVKNKSTLNDFVKYGISPTGTVTFDSDDNESHPFVSRRTFRKSSSETGVSPASGAARANIKRQIIPPHGIGILQPDGVVFDDALLLRLARHSRYSRLRGDHPIISGVSTERKFNSVKLHVYDLLQRDALVEMPYFNCNFPIGQCFKVMNNAANCLGTGAYHVGVEVNGIEYAFGANNIVGMSGVFTCPPKQSPGYEYRETLDLGSVYTTKNTWIRIPKENALGRSISNALAPSRDAFDEPEVNKLNTSTVSTAQYTFRQIESFADGNALIHSMAKEYMGTDYDLLRKNCCTFAHDVCIRLGVKEGDIPSWFHNAAKAGADAEDAITSAEQTVKNVFDCADMEGDPTDLMEGYNHGFEVIADLKRGSSKLKVVESPAVYRYTSARQPILDCEDHSEFWETLSWTY